MPVYQNFETKNQRFSFKSFNKYVTKQTSNNKVSIIWSNSVSYFNISTMKKNKSIFIGLVVLLMFTTKMSGQDAGKVNVIPGITAGVIKPVSLGENINSIYSDYMPVITADGKTIYFYVRNSPENVGGGDIWYSAKNGETWNKRTNISANLNNKENNYVISVSPDNNTLFLARKYVLNKLGKIADAGEGFSITHRTKTGWDLPQEVLIPDYVNKSEFGEFSLGANNITLILAVQGNETVGDKDLYVSFKAEDGKWSSPLNLGKTINTTGREISPFLAADGQTMFFSTDGRPGYGKTDIFISRRLDDTWTNWSEPYNLGEDINTPDFDAYFTLPASGKHAYFSSRKNTLGEADIFEIELPEQMKPKPVALVSGKVLNAETKTPEENAKVTYYNLITGVKLGEAEANPVDGSYKIVLPAGIKYSFMASKVGLFGISDNVDLSEIKEYKEIDNDLLLSPIKKGTVILLKNVFFTTGKTALEDWSFAELNRVVELLNREKTLIVQISGHTDNVGSDSSNQKLSTERANKVREYLLSKGIDEKRITSKGYGASKPIAPNTTDEGKKKNRRVDLLVLEI